MIKYIKLYQLQTIHTSFFQAEIRSYFRSKRKKVILKIEFQSNNLKRLHPLKAKTFWLPDENEGLKMLELKALNWGMSKIWKEILKIWNLGQTGMTKIPTTLNNARCLNASTALHTKGKTKMNFLLTQKSVQRNQFQNPGDRNLNSRMLTV